MSNWIAGAGSHSSCHPDGRSRVYTGLRRLPICKAHVMSVRRPSAMMPLVRRQLDTHLSPAIGGKGAVNDRYGGSYRK